MHLSLALLGPFRAVLGQEELVISRARKIEALLAYLALEANRSHHRETLDGLLFPESPDQAARNNLSQTLTRLRRVIGDYQASPPFILRTPETLQFNLDSDHELDVRVFWEKIQGCARHRGQREGHCPDCMRRLQEAAALYRGPFLDEFFIADNEDFEHWVQALRERLHQEALKVLQELSDYHERRGEYDLAGRYARRQLELDPWREQAHQQLMRLWARQGQRSAALAQYERCRQILSQEFDADPLPETEALCARIRAASDSRPYNLPPLSGKSFIGRGTELGDIRQRLVDPEQRLLTLVGPGGIGKTQLALKAAWPVAQDYLGPFMDGVYFVPLMTNGEAKADVSSASLVRAIVQALDLSLSTPEPPQRQLLTTLRDKECLLVVDNGERLNESGRALIWDILRRTGQVQILVASRQRLDLGAEWVLEIEGLPFPEQSAQQVRSDSPATLGPEVEACDAVQLFIQRARQVHGGLTQGGLTSRERQAIVRISQLAQGTPLTIELAAAWVQTLSPQQIAEEIEKNLDILTHAQPDRPARQHSIRTVFEHSWCMLSPEEQRVLVQLSVFQGSFSREAAEQVTDANLFALSSLRDKSLLQSVREQDDMRYEMHPLLRQFSAEKISQPHLVRLLDRHAQYYGQFLHQRHQDLNGPRLLETRREIQKEIENVRAGWRWAIQRRQISLIGQYADPLCVFYNMCGWRHEARDMFGRAVTLKGEDLLPPDTKEEHALVFADLLSCLAEFNQALGALDKAESLLQESQAIAFRFEDGDQVALAHERLGAVAHRRGNYTSAMEFLQFALQVARDIDKPDRVAHVLMSLGAVARDQGDLAQAGPFFQESAAIYQALGQHWGIAHALRLLALVSYKLGDYSQAQSYDQDSLRLFQAIDNPLGEGLVWNNLGQIAQAEQQYEQAQRFYARGLALLQKVDDDMGVAISFKNLGRLMLELGHYQQARAYFYASFKKAAQVQDATLILKVLVDIAEVCLQDRPDERKRSHIAELLHIVYQHPASTPAIKSQVSYILAQLATPQPALPGAFSALTGSMSKIEQLVESILSPQD